VTADLIWQLQKSAMAILSTQNTYHHRIFHTGSECGTLHGARKATMAILLVQGGRRDQTLAVWTQRRGRHHWNPIEKKATFFFCNYYYNVQLFFHNLLHTISCDMA
jgi:hypothetical protein